MRPRIAAAIAGAGVLVLGFGVMATLSATGQWTVGYSMWHYRAATWGDILFVPGIAAALAAGLAEPQLHPARRERVWGLIGAAVFGIAGAVGQVSWLASDKPLLNWTIPSAHHFSFPGWYHAAYLVIVTSTVGWAGTVLSSRVRAAPVEEQTRLALTAVPAVLVGFGVSFGAALGLDSADSVNTSAGAGSALGAAGAALVVLVLCTTVFGPRRSVAPIWRGLAIAAVATGAMLITYGIPK
jgi:hypothetical protein